MSTNRPVQVLRKQLRDEKRFCCNPFAKANHVNWRKTSKLTKVTKKLIYYFKSIGSATVPNLHDKICATCRLKVTRLPKNRQPEDELNLETASEDELNLEAAPSVENIEKNDYQIMNDILSRLGIQNDGVKELRREGVRCRLFKQAVDALKQMLKVDCSVYYQDTDVPVVKDIIDNCKTSPKPVQFQILTLLTPSWSRQKMINETGCSKWFAEKSLKVRDTKGILKLPDAGTSLSESEKKAHAEAKQYFLDCSTMMPGIRDKISVRTTDGRETRQKRLLLGSLNELYANFKDLFPISKIGFSTFAKLRPPECILTGSSGTHSVCVCMKHENIELCLRAVNALPIMKDSSLSQLIHNYLICKSPSPQCYFLECEDCPDLRDFSDKLLDEIEKFPLEAIKFKNWIQTENHYQLVDNSTSSPEEFVHNFSNLLNGFLPHFYITKAQKNYLFELKSNLKPNEVIVYADFAENYKITVQNEIQSHHFARQMVTLHPFVIYYIVNGELNHKTLIIISPVLEHNYVLVHCCFKELFDFIKFNLPQITKVHVFTDGAGSQYKNKYNFTNITFMKTDFQMDVEWNFHASSHGKCPCDGVAGTIKRAAYKYSLTPNRDNLISDALSFYEWAVEHQGQTMAFSYVKQDDYNAALTKLQLRMVNVQTMKGTHNYHCFLPQEEYILRVKKYSKSPEDEIKNLKCKK